MAFIRAVHAARTAVGALGGARVAPRLELRLTIDVNSWGFWQVPEMVSNERLSTGTYWVKLWSSEVGATTR